MTCLEVLRDIVRDPKALAMIALSLYTHPRTFLVVGMTAAFHEISTRVCSWVVAIRRALYLHRSSHRADPCRVARAIATRTSATTVAVAATTARSAATAPTTAWRLGDAIHSDQSIESRHLEHLGLDLHSVLAPQIAVRRRSWPVVSMLGSVDRAVATTMQSDGSRSRRDPRQYCCSVSRTRSMARARLCAPDPRT